MEDFFKKDGAAFEIDFFEGILQSNPDNVDVLKAIGNVYTVAKQYEKGLEVDEKLAKLCPEDRIVFYNLACSYSLLQRPDEAISALERSIQLGYHDIKHMEKDPDLDNIREDARYKKLVSPR